MFKGGYTTGSIIRRPAKPKSTQRREWRSKRRYPKFVLNDQPSPDLYKNQWQIEDEREVNAATVTSNFSTSTNVFRNRVEEDKPKRNFGDYDPVQNKTAPRSDRCRIVRQPKLENRRVVYKGISDSVIKERWNSHKNTVFENTDYTTFYPTAREINHSTPFPDTIKIESTITSYIDDDDDDSFEDLRYNKPYKSEICLPHIKTEPETVPSRKKSRWDVRPSSSYKPASATCAPSTSTKTALPFQSTAEANSNKIRRVPSNHSHRHYYEDTVVREEDASDPEKVARIIFDPTRRQPETVKIFRNRFDDLM